MTKDAEKNQADLRELVVAQEKELATLRAKLKGTHEGGKAPPEVAPIEINVEVLISGHGKTEKEAQQIIAETKRVKIDVSGEITRQDVTQENQQITVPAPNNLDEGQLILIDLIKEDWGKINTLAYDVKTNEQGLYLKPRGAAEQKILRQQ